ncbi:hypothetical protein P8452_32680 [Trifolium repens]|nr:hypothetical protein P8452_32680 [Trifolium repens]
MIFNWRCSNLTKKRKLKSIININLNPIIESELGVDSKSLNLKWNWISRTLNKGTAECKHGETATWLFLEGQSLTLLLIGPLLQTCRNLNHNQLQQALNVNFKNFLPSPNCERYVFQLFDRYLQNNKCIKLNQLTINSGGVASFALFNVHGSDDASVKEAVAVIKLSSSRMATQSECLGYEFAKWLGVQTPQARVIHNTNSEWLQIKEAAEKARDSASFERDAIGETTCSELLKALELSRCLLFMRMDEMMRGQRGWRELSILGDKMNMFSGMIEGLIWSPQSNNEFDKQVPLMDEIDTKK